jgi:para-aminobenzoate synthetase component 1
VFLFEDVIPLADLEVGAVLARLPAHRGLVVVRDGPATIVAVEPTELVRADGADALKRLDELGDGWWAGFLAYDLGRAIERVPSLNAPHGDIPDLLLGRFDARLVLEPGAEPRLEGSRSAIDKLDGFITRESRALAPPALRDWRSSLDEGAWTAAVRKILGHLRAGDCYQVNLTRRLECDAATDPIALFAALERCNPAPHAALVRLDGIDVVSASPERFLRRDGSRIETRPIKGTAADTDALRASAKDRAENVMIVDLARNDLGRVCEYGSVHVPGLWDIEEHPGLYHMVSTVRGTLCAGVTPGDVIRATFPPASVTGCPKPRVLEIIETLEPVRRGVYCGAVGFIDGGRDLIDLNVAIRTFTTAAGVTSFGVGGGIVADSDPESEWAETELKAHRLLAIAGGD